MNFVNITSIYMVVVKVVVELLVFVFVRKLYHLCCTMSLQAAT